MHRSVLLEEIIQFLNLSPGNIIIDATIGGGGHALEIMKGISPEGQLIGIDKDSESLRVANERIKSLPCRFKLVNKDFRDIKEIITTFNLIGEVDGILFDLGISSIQMDTEERGFSIRKAGPLDMRMDRKARFTARDLVNNLSENDLSLLLRDFGEERFHKRIARKIVLERKRKIIETTTEFAKIVTESIPYSSRKGRIHPATRTFQALRIKVNDELSALEDAINQMPYMLKKGGRVCVISFHSLEDRIVKHLFRRFAKEEVFHIVTKKPVRPKDKEVMENPRARSAKLRVAEKA